MRELSPLFFLTSRPLRCLHLFRVCACRIPIWRVDGWWASKTGDFGSIRFCSFLEMRQRANLVVGDDCPELSVFRWCSSVCGVVVGGFVISPAFPCLPSILVRLPSFHSHLSHSFLPLPFSPCLLRISPPVSWFGGFLLKLFLGDRSLVRLPSFMFPTRHTASPPSMSFWFFPAIPVPTIQRLNRRPARLSWSCQTRL